MNTLSLTHGGGRGGDLQDGFGSQGADNSACLEGFLPHLNEACVGSISEIFDAEPPYTPRGCVAQAWSVAEALRCWIRTEPGG